MPSGIMEYPTYLPKVQVPGLTIQMGQTHRIEEQIDGSDIITTAWTMPVHLVGCEVLCSRIDIMTEWVRWYTVSLGNGTEWFFIYLGMGGKIRPCLAHFAEGFSISQLTAGILTSAIITGYRITFDLLIYQQMEDKAPWQGA